MNCALAEWQRLYIFDSRRRLSIRLFFLFRSNIELFSRVIYNNFSEKAQRAQSLLITFKLSDINIRTAWCLDTHNHAHSSHTQHTHTLLSVEVFCCHWMNVCGVFKIGRLSDGLVMLVMKLDGFVMFNAVYGYMASDIQSWSRQEGLLFREPQLSIIVLSTASVLKRHAYADWRTCYADRIIGGQSWSQFYR